MEAFQIIFNVWLLSAYLSLFSQVELAFSPSLEHFPIDSSSVYYSDSFTSAIISLASTPSPAKTFDGQDLTLETITWKSFLPLPPIHTPSQKFPTPTPTSSLDPNLIAKCPFEIDHMFGIQWLRTPENTKRVAPCPVTFSGRAQRFCRRDGKWDRPDFSQCQATSIDGLDITARLLFNSGEENAEDADQFIRQLQNLTRPPPRNLPGPFLNRADLMTINFVSRRAISILRENANNTIEVSEIFGLFNNALDSRNRDSWEDLQQFESGSEELLSNAENYASLIASRLTQQGENVRFSDENIVLRAERPSFSGSFRDSQFPSVDDLINSSAVNSSIRIPSRYLEEAAAGGSDINVSVAFMLFLTLQDFLPYSTEDENTTISSVILSAQVISNSLGKNINSVLTEDPIELIFSINATYNALTENISVQCVFWNFSSDFNTTSSGGWVSEGIVTEIIDGSTVRCLSQHLTSFAVLVDVVGSYTESNDTDSPNEVHRVILSYVSYIGCGISVVCLILTIIFLLYLKGELLNQVHNFIHLNLAISLLMGLVVFIGGIEHAAEYKVLCTIVALLLHYFFLSAFCWMFCEAMMLYLLTVVVFSRMAKKWYLFLLIGWITPLIIVSISFGAFFSNYITESGICWLNSSNYVIWSFTGPMCLIILVNTVLLFIVCVNLILTRKKMRPFKRIRTGHEQKSDFYETRKTVIKITKALFVLLPLLGVTWLVGIFALDENTLFFAWLFTLLNSLQGVFIFFFHVIKNQRFINAFKSWYEKRKRMHAETTISTRKSIESLDKLEKIGVVPDKGDWLSEQSETPNL